MSPAWYGWRVPDILFVQSTLEIGGAETVLLNLLAANPELRLRSAVATLGFGKGNLVERLQRLGVEVWEFQSGRLREPWKVAGCVGLMAARARVAGIKTVVSNGAHPHVVASAVSRLCGARCIFLVNLIPAPKLFSNHPIDVAAYGAPCELWLGNSKACLDVLRQLRPGMRSELLYPGTPILPVTTEEREQARRTLGATAMGPLFGVFGRLQRWKGQDVFVDAAARVARAIPQARFAVVGGSVFGLEPEYAQALKDRAVELGIQEKLIFTGFRDDVPALMAACDVVCHTTRAPEPFGMVVVEAMAQSKAVVATRGGGPSEIIRDGVDGLLVTPDDSGTLAAAMLRLGNDVKLRTGMGAQGRDRVAAHFSSTAMASGLLDHIKALQK